MEVCEHFDVEWMLGGEIGGQIVYTLSLRYLEEKMTFNYVRTDALSATSNMLFTYIRRRHLHHTSSTLFDCPIFTFFSSILLIGNQATRSCPV